MVQFVEDIQENLGLTPQALEREFAVLRHCELLCGFKKRRCRLLHTKY